MRHGLDTSFLVAVEVDCHAEHAAARASAEALRRNDDRFAIAPQVVAEFVHIVTDAKRFSAPLTIERALERAKVWWDAKDVDRVSPDERIRGHSEKVRSRSTGEAHERRDTEQAAGVGVAERIQQDRSRAEARAGCRSGDAPYGGQGGL